MSDVKKCDNPFGCSNVYERGTKGSYFLRDECWGPQWDVCSERCLAQLVDSRTGEIPVVIAVTEAQVASARVQVQMKQERGEEVSPAMRAIAEARTP